MISINFFKKNSYVITNNIINFINTLNLWRLSLFISFFLFLAHPAMTEHIEFALTGGNSVYISKFNNSFIARLVDKSSQITVGRILLDFGLNPNYAQIAISFLLTLVPVSALTILIKFISGKNKIDNVSLSFLCILFYMASPINTSYYPWSPRIYFFEFGNQGLWLFVISIITILLNKSIGYFLAGILFSWHMVWFIPIALFYILENKKITLNFFLTFMIGFLISIFLLHYPLSNSALSSSNPSNSLDFFLDNLKPQKIESTIWTGHNPTIFGEKVNFYYLLTAFLPIAILNFFKKEFHLCKKLLTYSNALFILTLSILSYVELCRILPLPFSSLLLRVIANRYLNFLELLLLINFFLFFYFKKDWIFSKKDFYCLLIPIACLLYLRINFILLSLFILYLTKKGTYFVKNSLKLSMILIFLIKISIHDSQNYFSVFGFLKQDPIIQFFSGEGRGAGYIVSRNIQSFHGLNVTTLSNSQYFVPSQPFLYNHRMIDPFCYDTISDNYFEWDVDNCFKLRSKEEWSSLFDLMDVKYVIVHDNISLNLDLILASQSLRIYGISNDSKKETIK